MAKKETKNKDNAKNKKSFFKDFKAELKRVSWPTTKQLFNNTVAVISIVLLTTIVVFALDITFESANKYGIDKIKESITKSNSDNQNVETKQEDNNEVKKDDNNKENNEKNKQEENKENK